MIEITAHVVTVSDRCYTGETIDTSGPALRDRLARDLDADVAPVRVVSDEPDAIVAALRAAIDQGVDLVLTTGGTGFSPRDVTPEATRSVLTREAPGLAEAVRARTAASSPRSYLSRGIAGIAKRTLIVNLPGSRRGATEGLAALVDLLPHAIAVLRGEDAHSA